MSSLNEILQKAESFNKIIQDRHSINGLVLPTLVLPPQGKKDYQTGNYENCAIWTGLYVAAQSLRFAATGDAQARQQAKSSLLSLHRLQDITGIQGLIARGYKIGNESTWDEEFFWKKKGDKTRQRNEWHQSNGHRWLGDASKSQFFGVVFGYFAFTRFCNPTKQEMQEIGKYLSNIVDKIMENEMKIVDKDNQATGYGNYSHNQYFGFGGIGPSLILSKLKLASQITKQDRFRLEYERLLYQEDYGRFLRRCRLNPPILNQLSTSFGSEDNLAMLNYYMFMTLEAEYGAKELCNKGLAKRWLVINDPENSLFNFVYHALIERETSALEIGIDSLLRFPEVKNIPVVSLKRKLPKSTVIPNIIHHRQMPIESRPIDEYMWRINPRRNDLWVDGKSGIMEFAGVDFLIAAYLGLYHGFIK